MNSTTEEQLPPPPQPPQPHRNSGSCDRHPDEQFTGFCPSCLCERLAVLDQSAAAASTSSGRKSASSALKFLFKPSSSSNNNNNNNNNNNETVSRGRPSSSSLLPELRRTKSFSGGGKNEGFFAGIFEPQRKSCDVRARNTLFSLFSQDDEKRTGKQIYHPHPAPPLIIINNNNPNNNNNNEKGPTTKSCQSNLEASTSSSTVVIKSKEEDELVVGEEEEKEFHDSHDNGDEIQVLEEEEEGFAYNDNNIGNGNNVKCLSGDQVREEILESEKVDLKTMKDHLDLDSQNKKVGGGSKDLKGSFWSAASVFSKKLRAWTRKNHKMMMMKNHTGSRTVHVPTKKANAARHCRDTQSEIADYGFGRRSCDTDPRFSLDAGRFSVDAGRFSVDAGRFSVDAGRISFDDPSRCSFDEPRASWDGYLIGGRPAFPSSRMPPPMVSVVEDAPVVVSRKDTQIPVEEPRRSSVSISGDDYFPGGAAQTKDYYSDSSSKRRKSLDRSSSIRKTALPVAAADVDDLKTKVSPPTGDTKNWRDLKDLNAHSHSNSNSLRDDYSESIDIGFRDNASVIGNGERKGSKKSRRWRAWNIWGLIYRKGSAKDEEEDRYSSRVNGVERSLSESWQDLRAEGGYGDPRGAFGRNVFRSNSSGSWRNSYNMGGGSFGSVRKGSIDANTRGRKKDEFVSERNRSVRRSPNNADNGMLRFYLTPLRGSRRGGSGKAHPAYSHSAARSVLRFY